MTEPKTVNKGTAPEKRAPSYTSKVRRPRELVFHLPWDTWDEQKASVDFVFRALGGRYHGAWMDRVRTRRTDGQSS